MVQFQYSSEASRRSIQAEEIQWLRNTEIRRIYLIPRLCFQVKNKSGFAVEFDIQIVFHQMRHFIRYCKNYKNLPQVSVLCFLKFITSNCVTLIILFLLITMCGPDSQDTWQWQCGINHLQADIILMNMCNLHGVPNTFLDELLTFLSSDLLPQDNNLTRTTYETKRMVMEMGLEHVPIHYCPAGLVFYEGEENRDLEECPKCRQPRYVPGSNKVPMKVLWYFPIIPRLQRLFRCQEVAKLLKYHLANQSEDGMLQSMLHRE